MAKEKRDLLILIGVPKSPRDLKPTLNSVFVAAAEARRAGTPCRIVVSVDGDCAVTREVLSTCSEVVGRVARRKGQAQSEVFMAIVRGAKESLVALISSGDLVSASWFSRAVAFAAEDPQGTSLLHPEANILFKTGSGEPLGSWLRSGPSGVQLVPGVDQTAPDFDANILRQKNLWSPIFITRRDQLLSHPLPKPTPGCVGEQRGWNCRVLLDGLVHRVVPGTVHFLREGSTHFDELAGRAPVLPELPAPAGLPRPGRKARKMPAKFAGWVRLAAEWEKIVKVEPRLALREGQLKELRIQEFVPSAEADTVAELCEAIGEKPDYLFIVHQLRRGGSELEALLHIRAILSAAPKSRIVLMTTESAQSDWLDRLPPEVRVVDFARATVQKFEPAAMCRILLKALIGSRPSVIHIKHSWQAWEVLRLHAQVLKQFSRLYVSLYCIDYCELNRPMSYGLSHLADCFPHVDGVFCDNERMAREIREWVGTVRTHVLRFPVTVASREPVKRKRESTGLRILWASRISRQKKVELLFEVASLLPEDRIDVYGEFSEPAVCGNFRRALRRYPNLVYHGGFDGLDSIDTTRFDLFLYTSGWDGLPNVLLEAGKMGLPIVASAVGGVPELITNETGYPAADAASLVRAIEAIRKNPRQAALRATRLSRLIDERHVFKHFMSRIRKVPDYLVRT